MIVLLSYATPDYRRSQRLGSLAARRVGHVDRVVEAGPGDLAGTSFARRNRALLAAPRGGGYWLWKPFLLDRWLAELPDDSILLYSDAAATCIADLRCLVDELDASGQPLLPFVTYGQPERKWTKPSLLARLGMAEPAVLDSDQMCSGFHCIRVGDAARAFYGEFLDLAQHPGVIDDTPCGDMDRAGGDFVEHRHDQSVYSLLVKRHGFATYRDPSQWGRKDRASRGAYGQLYDLHRQRLGPFAYLRGRMRVHRLARRAGH